ncbi:MAG: 6-phosphogluconolactonase [Marinovum algicola]|jgi:6-phosphogluconolactonase|uniref:6-phosphogluconolactonase n=1 Tax=Marinovum algicola TaxID=42444 RepID=A0A975WAF2_9RHOB|nr:MULTISPECIES: 6-phosphogluconolactonase [Marinovum]AKO97243.1 6-phosphogluconolactonase [Marinovum algicola DG 898]MDD9740260.1 6-phosphogluconolactonase [Marinovum sp. SP66]MDD9742393.1 6-phosphogluconolactonase [Marinovum sp. PR37]SEJ55812.1 6-phosphogluconolactonase [Marinovum algicola]SLN50850.1 6-phosphogluconolactonase [Marinovum algicola]
MDFVDYPDREMLAIDVANKLAGELRAALEHEDRVLMAVPGGTTPGPIFDDLCAADLDWSRVDVMLSDERWVPEDSERSNTRLLRQRLLVERAAAARYLPLYLPGDAPEERLEELEANITPRLPIQVLVLGMGADMHTASLFPGADKLAEALDPKAPALMAMRAPGAPEPRITLTAPVLDGAMSKHIIIFGAEKREALERARHLKPSEAPVAAVLSQAQVHWAP